MEIVVLSAPYPAHEIERLRAAGLDVVERKGGQPLRDVVDEAAALICLLSDRIDESLFAAAPRLRLVANVAVGYENVDREAAARRGILITNTPDVLTEATADLTFGLILSVARRIVEADRSLRAGAFPAWGVDQPLLGSDVYGRTLGILGMGRIGTAVARRGRLGFDMPILYHNRVRNAVAERSLSAEWVSLSDLLERSDIVSVHVPLSAETHHLLDRAAFERMKPSALLVNVARGPVLDEAALVEALRAERIAGAGLDVFENEPAVHPGLLEMTDRVVLTPHIGSATRDTRGSMARVATDNVLAVLSGRPPLTPVPSS